MSEKNNIYVKGPSGIFEWAREYYDYSFHGPISSAAVGLNAGLNSGDCAGCGRAIFCHTPTTVTTARTLSPDDLRPDAPLPSFFTGVELALTALYALANPATTTSS